MKAAATRALDAALAVKPLPRTACRWWVPFDVGKRVPVKVPAQLRTGASIKIKAAKVPKFRPVSAAKDALN